MFLVELWCQKKGRVFKGRQQKLGKDVKVEGWWRIWQRWRSKPAIYVWAWILIFVILFMIVVCIWASIRCDEEEAEAPIREDPR